MAYLAPIHRPSSVRHALKLNLLEPEEECLVLAKANRVEIWTLNSGRLGMVHSQAIYGRVTMLEKIRPAGAETDHLFVGTLRGQYFTVAWNPETRRLDTVQSFVDLSEKFMQRTQSRNGCIIEPKGQYLAIELHRGVLNFLKVIKPRKGNTSYLDTPSQIRIKEQKIRASTFLYTETNRPKIAILYDAGKAHPDVRLATYRIVDEKSQYSEFEPHKDRENDLGDLDIGASHLIPIPKGELEQRRYIVRNATTARAQLGGVVVVGETKMTYLDDESKAVLEYPLEEASIWIAWERYDDLHYLLADNYARLHLLTLDVDGADVTDMHVREIGKITKATVMIYMGDNILFIASHEGDSQVVRLDLESETPTLELLQAMSNIAPVLDFAVMDMGGRDGETQTNEYSSGQARLVSGSGGWEEGSLRSIRSGVGLEDLAILADLEDINGLFAISSGANTSEDDVLVVSFPTHTRILRFTLNEEIEELESFRGFSLDSSTLLALNISGDLIIQVTTTAGMILNSRGVTARWRPPTGQVLTAASANEKYVLLAVNGTTLVTLDVQKQLEEVKVQNMGNGEQIACIHVPSHAPNIGIVGLWRSGSISIINLTTLEVIQSEDLRRADSASIPRDIVMAQVLPEHISGPTLFVAMEDGIVLTFSVDRDTFELSGRKSIVLGTQQAQFKILPRDDGLFNVFATCEHPSLIYGSEGRIVYSAVTAESATHVCSFNNKTFPKSIVVATAENLKISQIDTERRTHVKTLPMGETVRRIAYSPNERAFGIGAMKRELINGEEIVTSTIRLVEDVLFGEMGKPLTLQDQNGAELIECIIRAELPIEYGDGQPAERFIVGTSYLDEDIPEANARGRILIIAIDIDRSPYIVSSHVLKGACRCLAVLDGKIVAALTKTVVMYKYEENTETSAILTKVATYRTSTCPISLDVTTSNIIAVGDMMKSISLVQYTPGEEGLPDRLEEVARHMQSGWTTAVVHIEDDSYLSSDHDGNLLVLRRNLTGVTLSDRKRLELTSEINLGEQVNKIVRVNVVPSPNAMVIPHAFLGTTEGSIYLFSTIAASSQDLLMRLQVRMTSIIVTLGELDFNTYRRFQIEALHHSEPFRFVDGELIERFLDVSEEVQEEICQGLGPSVEDVRNMVEELKRLH